MKDQVQAQAGIRWPPHYRPQNCPIHVVNQIEVAAPAERVWAWLVRAALWPDWYPNSRNVRFLSGTGPDLAQGTRFRWRTFGVNIVSQVLEFVPRQRLAWDAKAFGIDAYHAWLITQTAGGCRVLTEETQHGLVARAGVVVFPGRMQRLHQVWLERLAAKAAAELPG